MKAMGSDPREEGRVACEQGMPRSDCPYSLETHDYHAWIEGWDEAEEAKVVAGEEDEGEP
jgi:ribosome modulation factor